MNTDDPVNESASSYDIAVSRGHEIIKTSVVGILANLALSGFKAVAGLAANSIAMVLDAVNNLTDALSSAITIAGTMLAGRKPDKKHPLGHGRSEYLSAMVIAILILYAGITAAIESVDKMFHPKDPEYSAVTLVILAVAVVVKILLGRYVRAQGEKVHSDSLKESGADALFDALISAAVLVSAVVYMLTGLLLEAYVSLAISVFIIRAGLGMLFDTLDDIMGKRAPEELTSKIKETICEDECALNAYDLILHSYGPAKTIGSVHVEVDESLTAYEIDAMERRIAHNVLLRHGILLTGIGIYSRNMSDDAAIAMRRDIENIVMSHEGVLQMHGYYLDKENHTVNLDIIIDYDIKTREELFDHIRDELVARFPDYLFSVVQDIDI
ncbi:MAG: cation diffusion facilitator family transporter [Lachnospiraceae bacterium]|nr:cation diffusion facilitator family transporter [Lachnospiraceae bacterium]